MPANDNFAACAARLAGLVCATTGWTPDQFWSATPAELAAIYGAFAAHDAALTSAPPTPGQFEKLKEQHPDG